MDPFCRGRWLASTPGERIARPVEKPESTTSVQQKIPGLCDVYVGLFEAILLSIPSPGERHRIPSHPNGTLRPEPCQETSRWLFAWPADIPVNYSAVAIQKGDWHIYPNIPPTAPVAIEGISRVSPSCACTAMKIEEPESAAAPFNCGALESAAGEALSGAPSSLRACTPEAAWFPCVMPI